MDRYVSLWKSPLNLYCDNCPVLVAAGALLKDNQTGGILAQLKLKNLTDNAIKAVKVKIISLSVSGEEMPQTQEYQYLDLAVTYNKDFGSKQPIVLPDATARSFAVVCQSVVFTDGTNWQNESDSRCVPADFPYGVRQKITDAAMFSQFIRDTEIHQFWQNHSNEPFQIEDFLSHQASEAYVQEDPELLQEITEQLQSIQQIISAPRSAESDFSDEEKSFMASLPDFLDKLNEAEQRYKTEEIEKKGETTLKRIVLIAVCVVSIILLIISLRDFLL